MKRLHLILILLVMAVSSQAQEKDPASEDKNFTTMTPVTIDFGNEEEEDETVEPKKKKRKKKVFYGIKTRKSFTRSGYGERQQIELFYTLKEPIEVDVYVRDIYWYDFRRKEIRKGGKVDQKYGAILHGPYRREQNGQILEEGIFYKGLKHGRWMKYDKDDLLVDKEKYYKGWPKESLVTYYDRDRTNMREIVPIEYGEKEGNYFYFHESGRIAVKGEYKWDIPVGDWVEYYESGRRKKIIRYGKDPFDETFRPYTWKEWSDKGKLVYQKR